MLKGIDRRLTAEVLQVLMQMGHGDELVICDVNHPAVSIAKHTTYGKLIDMAGCDIPQATAAILTLMPLDTFVDAPVMRMKLVDDPDGQAPVFALMQRVLDAADARPIRMGAYERFDFYAAARRAFAIIRTSDPGPYGCFILKKGVI
jgi:L-fucose mutarotase